MGTAQRGIIDPREGFRHFRLDQRDPAPDLAAFVEQHWIVEWDLADRDPFVQETLPHPSLNLVVEDDGGWLYGVDPVRFRRVLEGRGRAVGTKFRPGGCFPFLGRPVVELTGRSVPARAAFGADVRSGASIDDQVAATEAFLRARLPAPDPNVEVVARVFASILDDLTVTRIDDLAARHGMSTRSLQRLFRRYVGVTPKWVLRRFRLHEALERAGDGAEAAQDLGYYDQAHLINEFRASVGRPPGAYAAANG
jgi:AraC-like DNA-binding protein